MMKIWFSIGVVCFLMLPGCVVSKSKYSAAVSDMESAKAELEKSRMHRDALEQQIKNLKGVNEKMSRDFEVMTSEVRRIKDGRQNEQALLETREKELHQEKKVLIAKLRGLNGQYKKLKGQNKALKGTVLRYQKELKEARQKKTASLSAPTPSKPSSLTRKSTSATIPPSSKGRPSSKMKTSMTSKKDGLSLVNINKATVSDLVLFLGLTKEMAQGVVDHRPYRLRGELVAKKVVPKATFDVIKSRITAAQ